MVVFHFDKDASVIVLYTNITGKIGKIRLKTALDTGSTFVIVPYFIAESLGYDPAASDERVPLTTASGVETAPLITVEAISVLGLRAESVKIACHDLPPTSRVDGLLGLSYLRNFKLTLDFKNGVMKLE